MGSPLAALCNILRADPVQVESVWTNMSLLDKYLEDLLLPTGFTI